MSQNASSDTLDALKLATGIQYGMLLGLNVYNNFGKDDSPTVLDLPGTALQVGMTAACLLL